MLETQVWSLGQEDPLEEEMATHSSILAWKIPWTEEPGSLQSMGSQSRTWMSIYTHRTAKGKCFHYCLSYCVLTGCQDYCKSYIIWSSITNCFCLLSFQMSFEIKLLHLTQFCFFWWPVQRVKLLIYLSWLKLTTALPLLYISQS